MLLRLRVFALEIKRRARSKMRFVHAGRLVERSIIQGESFVLLALAAEFLPLLHKIIGTAGGRCGRRLLG